MRLPQHEDEGHDEELIPLIVTDMLDPVAPILQAAFVGEGLHDVGCMIACLCEVVHHGAAAIHQDLHRIGAAEIDLVMFGLPSVGRLA